MNEHELIARIAATLKREIGPQVSDEYPKTQAFMASVVLGKLAAELASADTSSAAEAHDYATLIDAVNALDDANLPASLATCLAALKQSPGKAALSQTIISLYEEKAALSPAMFEQLLGLMRTTMRADLDRRLDIAR